MTQLLARPSDLATESSYRKFSQYSSIDLVPQILVTVPSDPLHGGPFGYRLTPDDPHGRPYLLYSTGLDRNDDGGDFES